MSILPDKTITLLTKNSLVTIPEICSVIAEEITFKKAKVIISEDPQILLEFYVNDILMKTREKPMPLHTFDLHKIKVLKQKAESIRNLDIPTHPVISNIVSNALGIFLLAIVTCSYICLKKKFNNTRKEEPNNQQANNSLSALF